MTMLLALATAFSLFTLVFLATQAQHIQDIVTYQTGADFSAQLFALQSALSTHITLPPSLPLVLVALAAIYLIALLVMVRVVAQPAMRQKLRLDEA